MPLIVFDLDGTLIDSQRDIAESTNEMLESYGVRPRPIEEVTGMVGEGAKVLVARALAAAGLDRQAQVQVQVDDALERFLAIYNRRLLKHTLPYPGIPDVLQRAAARASLAVLSNKPEAPTRRLLEAFDLSRHFGWVMGGDAAFPRKPDPAGLRHLIDAAGETAASTLFVGDSMIDVETARAARVRIAVVLFGFGARRGDMVLRPEESTAADVAALSAAIERFLTTAPGGTSHLH